MRSKYLSIGQVIRFDYDPIRNVPLALILYVDGTLSYIITPHNVVVGQRILSSTDKLPISLGNHFPVGFMPVGTLIHNIELIPGYGGQLARSAGT